MRFSFGEYQLDTEARSLQRSGQAVHVEPKVFDLLAYLIEHRDRVASPDELLEALWPGAQVGPAALSNAVRKLREAVGDDGDQQALVRTKHGHGFQFVAEVSVLPAVERTDQLPSGFRVRWVATAGVVALVLAVAAVWLLNRPVAELTPIRSIAVLPLANLSGDPEQEYFSDGMTEALISNLAKIRSLRVISRTSAMHYKDTRKTLPEIAHELNVDAIVEGSVLRAGDRVRITAQLVDGRSDQHLWAEEYERDLKDVLLLQSDIARAIADEVRVALEPEDEKRLASATTVDPEAYEWFVKGNYYDTIQEFERATEAHQKAIEIDPDYALAYAGLAFSYALRADWGFEAAADVLPQAYAAVEKALELDSSLSSAYSAMGTIKKVERNWDEAKQAYERAIELDPGYAWAHHDYAGVLSALDRDEEALIEVTRAQQINPLADLINASAVRLRVALGRYDEAIHEGKEALELNSDFRHVRLELIDAYIRAWRYPEAIEAIVWLSKVITLDPKNPDEQAQLGRYFMNLGDPDRAEYWFQASIELGPARLSARNGMMFLHLRRNDEAAAVDEARNILADFPDSYAPLMLLRNHELREGRFIEARALYEKFRPELLRKDPEVGRTHRGGAVDLASVLLKTGETEQADLLLSRRLQYLQTKPRLGAPPDPGASAQIFALQGKKQEALLVLRKALDESFGRGWWYIFYHEPNLESLHDEPEFQAMAAEIEAYMAEQLARVREMERIGELAAIPRSEVSLH
jgi:TolB-like protein/DNA-binding winged helix-turn-helix (wHTH) protein/Tfp pilus assembly protein PilF